MLREQKKKIKCAQWFAQRKPELTQMHPVFVSSFPEFSLSLSDPLVVLQSSQSTCSLLCGWAAILKIWWICRGRRQRSVKLHADWQFFVGDLSSLCEMPKYLRLVVVGGSCVGKTAVIEQAVFGNHSPGQVCLQYFHLTLTYCFSQRG